MKKILVEHIEDGMVLAREVSGTGGNTLLTKGTGLTAALGRRLQHWGITTVFIEGEEELAQQENTVNVSPEALMQYLTTKFGATANNPNMRKILDAIYRYRLRKTIR
jgi:hypothetical protein